MARHNNLCFEKALDAIEEYIDVHGLKENDALPAERKLAEEARRRKPVSQTLPWPLHQLLPRGSCPA